MVGGGAGVPSALAPALAPPAGGGGGGLAATALEWAPVRRVTAPEGMAV